MYPYYQIQFNAPVNYMLQFKEDQKAPDFESA